MVVRTPMTESEHNKEKTPPKAHILVADDEESMRYFLGRSLRRHGFAVEIVDSGDRAIELCGGRRFDLAVIDLKMPGADGIEVLSHIQAESPDVMVIIMTAYGTIRSAVDAMKRGAFDYITKPFEIDELLILIDRALKQQATLRENRELRRIIDDRTTYCGLIGRSKAMKAVYQSIDLLRESPSTVLITGASGTGKELVARAIHIHSQRFQGEFVPLNCATLPEKLLESELFGHEAGTFTGAHRRKRGLVERAGGGTLFLDEISEIAPPSQAKLLRFIQEREFTPLGATQPISLDLRIIAASNQDLEKAVAEGCFRQDLFWRLNVVPIDLPPLCERRDDIPLLINYFLEHYRQTPESCPREFTAEAMNILINYSWPGNVRELRNTAERLVVLHADKEKLEVEDIPSNIRENTATWRRGAFPDSSMPYKDAIRSFEFDYLRELFEETNGNISQAAQRAGISRQNLHRKIKQFGFDLEQFRS